MKGIDKRNLLTYQISHSYINKHSKEECYACTGQYHRCHCQCHHGETMHRCNTLGSVNSVGSINAQEMKGWSSTVMSEKPYHIL